MVEKPSIEHEVLPAIQSNQYLAQVVAQAAELLSNEAEGTGLPARAVWDATGDPDPVVEVRLSDELGSASKRFSYSELADRERVQWEMIRLWGDLLEVRSHQMLDRLRETATAGS